MKRLNLNLFAISCTIMLLIIANAQAADYKVNLAKMPVYAESPEKGVLVELSKALATESGKKIDIAVDPFARSMNNVETGKADFHMPLIAIPDIDMSTLPYDYSTETIFHVNFVLYTKKNSGITKEKLYSGGLKVETDIAHVPYFDFKVNGSANLIQSLKKVNAGRIDAFIFADFASDPLIKKFNFTNIRRDLFRVYDVKIILPKGGRGGSVDRFLSETIASMRTKGEFNKIMGIIEKPYDDWQL
jgi:polar amino acid transport system substrate-binding protein